MSIEQFDSTKLAVGLAGAVAIVGGVIAHSAEVEKDDIQSQNSVMSSIGSGAFVVGWIAVTASAGISRDGNDGSISFCPLKSGLAALAAGVIVFFAGFAQQVMGAASEQNVDRDALAKKAMLVFMAFAFGWLLLAVFMALSDVPQITDEGFEKQDDTIVGCKIAFSSKKFALLLAGAVGVVGGMLALMKVRRKGLTLIKTGKEGPAPLYSIGLPLFAASWVIFVLGNALVD